MAPSRALLQRATSVPHLYRASPSLLRTAYRTKQASYFSAQSKPLIGLCPTGTRHLPIRNSRTYSQAGSAVAAPEPPDYLNEAEIHIFNKIKAELEPVKLEVQDISGGCGSMYALEIESPKFKGLTVIKQHKLVNSILADEIKGWHGVQLRTKAA